MYKSGTTLVISDKLLSVTQGTCGINHLIHVEDATASGASRLGVPISLTCMTVSHYAGPKLEQISDQFRKHVYNSMEYILGANAEELRPEIPPNLNVDCMTEGMVMGGDSGMCDHGVSYIPSMQQEFRDSPHWYPDIYHKC